MSRVSARRNPIMGDIIVADVAPKDAAAHARQAGAEGGNPRSLPRPLAAPHGARDDSLRSCARNSRERQIGAHHA